MPGSARAELYFIAAMMFLILVLSAASVYVFFRTLRKEKSLKQAANDPVKQSSEPVSEPEPAESDSLS